MATLRQNPADLPCCAPESSRVWRALELSLTHLPQVLFLNTSYTWPFLHQTFFHTGGMRAILTEGRNEIHFDKMYSKNFMLIDFRLEKLFGNPSSSKVIKPLSLVQSPMDFTHSDSSLAVSLLGPSSTIKGSGSRPIFFNNNKAFSCSL